MKEELKILSCTGFGCPEKDSWEQGLSWNPDVIVSQGTSTDCGPGDLGGDAPFSGFAGVKEILRMIIVPSKRRGIPFIVSTGTRAGGNRGLERSLAFLDKMAKEENIKLRVAVIPGELDKEYLRQKIRGGVKIHRLVDTDRLPEYLTKEDVDKSERIVAQMGPEVIIKALDLDVDGVITGRALDVGLHMSLPVKRGFDKGLAAHMAKTIECGALVAEPQSFDGVLGTLRRNHFLVRPTNPNAKCTTVSVAAHSFYERPDPNREENPGGVLDITNAKYEQYDDRTVKVSGSRWVEEPYTLKIEGVRRVGYRTFSICGIRDERLISCIGWFLEEARKEAEKTFRPLKPNKDYDLFFRVYGKNGVLGDAEPVKQTKSTELGLVIDVVAREQELANAICTDVGIFVLHRDYPGRQTTGANVAFFHSPREYSMGPVYIWNVWHLLPLDDPCEPFKIQRREFPIRK